MQWEDFCLRYFCRISFEKFIDIRYIIKLGFQKLGVSPSRFYNAEYPQKPFLIDIALSTKRGCSAYYKILNHTAWQQKRMHLREKKWHEELDMLLSIDFWIKTRQLCAEIQFENSLKWLQFQIIRNSLQTNVIVSHFVRNVTRSCDYCGVDDEVISHLFWSCRTVNGFVF